MSKVTVTAKHTLITNIGQVKAGDKFEVDEADAHRLHASDSVHFDKYKPEAKGTSIVQEVPKEKEEGKPREAEKKQLSSNPGAKKK